MTATQRLRLVAHTLAGLRDMRGPDGTIAPVASLPLRSGQGRSAGTTRRRREPAEAAAELAGFYGRVADEVGHSGREAPGLIPAPPPADSAVPRHAAPSRPGPGSAAQQAQGRAAAASGSAGRPHPQLLWVQEHLHQLAATPR